MLVLVVVYSSYDVFSAGCTCMLIMTSGFGWRQKLYGGRQAIKKLHHRHKQYLQDQGDPTLLRRLVLDDSTPELLLEYEAGPRNCRHGYWYWLVAMTNS